MGAVPKSKPRKTRKAYPAELYAAFRNASEQGVGAVQTLLDSGITIPTGVLCTATGNRRFAIAKLLLAQSSANYSTDDLNQALRDSIEFGNKQFAEALLARGAELEARLGLTKETPLILAARLGRTELVELLVSHGAKMESQDVSLVSSAIGSGLGKTALMHAASLGHSEIVKHLLAGGADVNATGESGLTALDLVSGKGARPEISRLLRKAGGLRKNEIEAGSKNGQTARNHTPQTESPTTMAKATTILAQLCDGKASPHPRSKHITVFQSAAGGSKSQRSLHQKVANSFRANRFHVFETHERDIPACLALMRCESGLGMVEALKTANANFGVTHQQLLAFLTKLQKRQPFVVEGCGSSFVRGRFVAKPTDAKAFARELFEFCPFVASGHGGNLDGLTKHLEKTSSFEIWWD
jgi:hypothetical protein